VLAEVGEAGQARLAAASVLVVGAGGLGSPVLATLAGAGVGRLVVVDHDRVETTNLHRQPLFRMADLGRRKVEAARDALLAYNPEVAVEAEAVRLDPANAARLVARAGIVVDAADNLAVSYVLSDACREAAKPLVSASVLGQQGYVGAFCGGSPSYRAVFPDMPATVGSCVANGVLGSAVAVVGALQAHLVLQLVLGLTPSPLGRLLSVDLGRLAFGGFRFDGVPEPAGAGLPFIARTALSPADHVVDLRGVDEVPRPVTETAVRLTVEQVEREDVELPRDRRVVLCCRSGVRAHRAARALEARGFTNLALLAIGA
jgi:molybdopterin/thiamine biosynthesis adenylyltransferase/rhodanese-related sulfurtransferase